MGRKKKEMLIDLSTTYEVERLCILFEFPRSSFYYQGKPRPRYSEHDDEVKRIFDANYGIYGARKIKIELKKLGRDVSRRKIVEIMAHIGLVCKYVRARKRKSKVGVNSIGYLNLVRRIFKNRKPFEVVAADVTYVYFGRRRYYLCIMIDIATRMIVGHSVDTEIGAKLVEAAISSMNIDLHKVQIFHTDRGSEFNNIHINKLMEKHSVLRSLSSVSAPIDNAVVESMNNVIKIEWKYGRQISNLTEFRASWAEYVDWYNNKRIHGSLCYKTPVEFLQSFAIAS
jgi:putative transposase